MNRKKKGIVGWKEERQQKRKTERKQQKLRMNEKGDTESMNDKHIKAVMRTVEHKKEFRERKRSVSANRERKREEKSKNF